MNTNRPGVIVPAIESALDPGGYSVGGGGGLGRAYGQQMRGWTTG